MPIALLLTAAKNRGDAPCARGTIATSGDLVPRSELTEPTKARPGQGFSTVNEGRRPFGNSIDSALTEDRQKGLTLRCADLLSGLCRSSVGPPSAGQHVAFSVAVGL